MQQLDLWQQQPPSASALQSTQPFAVDTLDFHQWLQFIMIPRLQALLAADQPLPTRMAVSPMAAQVYKGQLKTHRELIVCIRELDILISGVDPMQAS
ncbi:MAG: YqcC family protein [Idiomarina sp.]|nr:YqcC family protein [Idiomarina sp.]